MWELISEEHHVVCDGVPGQANFWACDIWDMSLRICAYRKLKCWCFTAMSCALLCKSWLSVTSYVYLKTFWHVSSVAAWCMYLRQWFPTKLHPWWACTVMWQQQVLTAWAFLVAVLFSHQCCHTDHPVSLPVLLFSPGHLLLLWALQQRQAGIHILLFVVYLFLRT